MLNKNVSVDVPIFCILDLSNIFVCYQHFFPFKNKEKTKDVGEKTLCYHFNKIINNLCYSNMLNKYKLGLHFRGQHFFMSHKRYW